MIINLDLRLNPASQKELDNTLLRWSALTESLIAPMYRQGGDVIVEAFEENFIEGDSWWHSLAERTQAERMAQGFQAEHPILVRTGSFLASVIDRRHPLHFEQVTVGGGGFQIDFGSDDPRFEILHQGGNNAEGNYVPPRPFLFLGGPQEARLHATLSAIVTEELGLE